MSNAKRLFIVTVCLGILSLNATFVNTAEASRHSMETVAYNTVKIMYLAEYKNLVGDVIQETCIGSGVLIAPDRILTCFHLISGMYIGKFKIYRSDGIITELRENITVLKYDAKMDLMLLQTAEPFKENGIPLAERLPKMGEDVYFVGYTVLPVSSVRFDKFNVNRRGIMLWPVYRGDSGGGVYNTKGELIGIINIIFVLQDAGVQFPTFIGYAIPLETIKEFLENC